MVSRRIASGAVALCLAMAGLVATTSVAGADHENINFDKLKPIKEPANCDNPDQGITDDTIKVGLITILSGAQQVSWVPYSEDGVRARIEKANQEGELGDRQIELVVKDDAADVARNLTAAQQLNEEEDVFGIISMTNTMKGGAPYLHEEGVPVGGWHVGEGVWGIYENMFSWRSTQPEDPTSLFTTRTAEVLKKLGAKKIAVVGTNAESSAVNAEQTGTAVEFTKGMKLVYLTTDVTSDQADFTAIAAEIKEAGADGLYTSTAGVQANGLVEALNQAGVELKAKVFPGGYDSRVTGLPGYADAVFGTEFKPLELGAPGLDEYTEWMGEIGSEPLHFFGFHGWLSADVFINGIKAAGVGCPTREAFINNLRLVEDYDADGFFPPVDYAKAFGVLPLCIYYVQIVGDSFEPVFDGEPQCATRMVEDGKLRKLTKAEKAAG